MLTTPADAGSHSAAHVRASASRVANRWVGLFVHSFVWAMTCLLLLVVATPFVALVVGLAWGMGLGCHFALAIAAPAFRARWVEGEVSRRLGTTVAAERRDLEGRHARSLEELAASLAHEIRNPITAAKSLVQQAQDDPAAASAPEQLAVALEELDRVERAVSHLLRYAREEELHPEHTSLAEAIASAMVALAGRDASARVDVDTAVSAPLRGDPEQLRRVVVNLVSNALDAVEAGGAASRVYVACGTSLSGAEAWLRVRDEGPGIAPAHLARIWSPFFTTKQDGTGLGLAIARRIVEAHGGRIEAASEVGRGTEIVATFPAQPGASA